MLLASLGSTLSICIQLLLAPFSLQDSPQLKTDTTTVISIDLPKNEMKGTTPAGEVTYKVTAETPVYSAAGKKAGTADRVKVGDKIKVFYVTGQGADVKEINTEK
jgi:hypothetical protein